MAANDRNSLRINPNFQPETEVYQQADKGATVTGPVTVAPPTSTTTTTPPATPVTPATPPAGTGPLSLVSGGGNTFTVSQSLSTTVQPADALAGAVWYDMVVNANCAFLVKSMTLTVADNAGTATDNRAWNIKCFAGFNRNGLNMMEFGPLNINGALLGQNTLPNDTYYAYPPVVQPGISGTNPARICSTPSGFGPTSLIANAFGSWDKALAAAKTATGLDWNNTNFAALSSWFYGKVKYTWNVGVNPDTTVNWSQNSTLTILVAPEVNPSGVTNWAYLKSKVANPVVGPSTSLSNIATSTSSVYYTGDKWDTSVPGNQLYINPFRTGSYKASGPEVIVELEEGYWTYTLL